MAAARHLVRRFFGSLAPRRLTADERTWVAGHLVEPEAELFDRMGRADQRHALGVAQRAAGALGERASTPVVAAALLHDVGKIESGLGTYGRVMATLSAKVAGDDMAEAWSQTSGMTRRIGLYLRHEELGAEMLELAGSDPLTVDLVRGWSDHDATSEVLTALRAADDA